ncbi:ABC transporter ATP-binding protein [Microbacterium sp.]|uniref:ABC transporter ATP-binding protein n=1 Tax=Microbacterium sp. TaxID=51671 RepID=UPI0039E4238D
MSGILDIESITKVFASRGSVFTAVDDVSFSVPAGSTFGLVGESGSGKSTVARCALRLIEPTSGTSRVGGEDLARMGGSRLRSLRATAGMVFQNPVAALNPRMTVRDCIAEPLRTHRRASPQERARRVDELLDEVGLGRVHADRYPHQLSGGQCQRVGIARAIAMRPRLLILDEPTSALDVSVQAQVLNLLADLKRDHGLSYLLISHDLDVVRHMSDVVAVMRRGRIIESGPAAQVLVTPQEEYTARLLASMPPTPGARASTAGAPPLHHHLTNGERTR